MDSNANTCGCTISVDYKAEWYRQRETIMKLESENKRLRDTIIGMCKALYEKGGVQECQGFRCERVR